MCPEEELCGLQQSADENKTRTLKSYCANCKQNRQIGHLFQMYLLKNVLPMSNDYIFVFYDFESTQDTKASESATMQIPNMVCLHQLCSRCETLVDID